MKLRHSFVNTLYILSNRIWKAVVVTYMNEVRWLWWQGWGNFNFRQIFISNRSDWRRGLHIFLPRVYRGLFPERIKRLVREADRWFPCSADHKNPWGYTFTPPYDVSAWCLVKRDNKFPSCTSTDVIVRVTCSDVTKGKWRQRTCKVTVAARLRNHCCSGNTDTVFSVYCWDTHYCQQYKNIGCCPTKVCNVNLLRLEAVKCTSVFT